jgi:hypothetical protein
MSAYKDFTNRLKLLFSKNPDLIVTTLSNIFTMRLIGNKTHGDLAEIAISEFINQYMYDFKSQHVGKDLYRAKSNEEDISVTNEITKEEIPVSLKAYGDGPLQLSTDKNSSLFPTLQKHGPRISGGKLKALWDMPEFSGFGNINILPLIYDEKAQKCNILVFDAERAKQAVDYVVLEDAGRGRKHPVFRFYDALGGYICEVRYGSATANALQRGLWTHTRNGLKYFDSLTGGWVSYSHNFTLVSLFSHALVSTERGHAKALDEIKADIEQIKRSAGF